VQATNIEVNVTATDDHFANVTIYLYNSIGLYNSSTSTNAPFYLNFMGLKDGIYYINATAYDTFGNFNSTETRNVEIKKAGLNCIVVEGGCINNYENWTDVLHISNMTNAHAELPNGTNYNLSICCRDNDGVYAITNKSGTTFIVLSHVTDAHVELPGEGNYPFNALMGAVGAEIKCDYRETSGACIGNETCVATVGKNVYGGTTNMHMASCSDNPYNMSICCQITLSPRVVLESPNDNYYNNISSTTFNCSASAPNGLQNLTLFVWNSTDSYNISTTALSGNNGSAAWTLGNMPNGNYSWNCQVYDSLGLTDINPTNRTLTVDIANPLIQFVPPTEISGHALNRNNIFVNVSVVEENLAELKISLYDSNGLVTAYTDYYEINFTGLADGTYWFNATALDFAGNRNYTETRNVTIDTIYPVISIINPLDSNILRLNVLLLSNVTDVHLDTVRYGIINGTVDSGNTIASGIMDTTYLGGDVFNSTLLTNEIWPYDASLFNSANLTFVVYANDSAGNKANASSYFVLDNSAPAIVFVNPNASGVYIQDAFGLHVALSNYLLNYSNYTITNSSGDLVQFNETDLSAASFDWIDYVNMTVLPDDNYTINVYARDYAGNENNESLMFIYLKSPINAIIISPENEILTNETAVNFTINLSSPAGLANATLSIYNATGLYNITTINLGGVGNTIVSVVVNLVSGVYSWFWEVFDLAGNYLNTGVMEGANRTLEVDRIAPQIYFADSTLSSNSIINESNFTVNVISSDKNFANMVVNFYNSSDFAGYAESYEENFSTGFIAPGDGTYWFNATAYDLAGNFNSTETRNITIDTTKPMIDFTAPTEIYGSYLNRNNILVNVTASDANFASITIYLYNSVGLINASTLSSLPYYLNFTGLGDGTYWFNATAIDLAGNSNSTETRNATIDTTTPTINFTFPTETSGSYLNSRNNIIVNVSAAGTNIANITVNLYNSGGLVSSASTTLANLFVNFTNLVQGAHWFNATVYNLAGNSNSTETRNATVNISIPVVEFLPPSEANGSYINRSNIQIMANSTGLDIANISISLYNSTGLVYSGTNASTQLSANVAGLADGAYYFSAISYNFEGLYGTNARNVTIDTTTPTINFTSPTEQSGSNISRNNILANVSAAGTNLANITIYLYNSTGLVNASTSSSLPYYINFTNLADGAYYFNATILNLAGNFNSTETRNVTIDTTLPSINFIDPTPSDGSIMIGSINVNISATDLHLANITIYLYNETDLLNSTTNYLSPDFASFAGLGTGTYYINATAHDTFGNANSTETRVLFVDLTAPNVTIITPANNTFTNNTQVNFTASLSDNAGLANATLNIYNASGALYNQSFFNLGGVGNAIVSSIVNMIAGTYSWFWEVFDLAGNFLNTGVMEGANRTLIVDTTAPFIAINSPLNISYNSLTLFVNITATDLHLDSIWFVNGTNTVAYTVPSYYVFAEGSNTLVAYANDSAGNVNSTNVIFNIDLIAPAINFTSPTPYSGAQITSTNIEVNVTAEDANLANITIYLYNSTGLVNSSTLITAPYYLNFTGIRDGIYWFNATALDFAGNRNYTETRNVSAGYPFAQFVSPTPANGTVTTNTSAVINISITNADDLSKVIWNWNGTNYTCEIKSWFGSGNYSCTNYEDNSLVLAFNFDNVSAIGESATKAVDAGIYGNDGTLGNNSASTRPTWTQSGKYNKALSFDGINDFVKIPYSNSLAFANGSRFSESFWMYPKEGVRRQGVISNRNSDNGAPEIIDAGFECTLLNNILYCFYPGGGFSATASITLNAWQHITVTFNNTNISIYLNGNLASSVTSILPYTANQNNFSLGWDSTNSTRAYNGSFDEVRIWNRSLSAAEIRRQYYSNLQRYDTDKWQLYVNESLGTSEPLGNINYNYAGCAKDLAGNENCTETRVLTKQAEYPGIEFVAPTPENATSNSSLVVNISITKASDLNSVKWNWNGTNYTMYNSSLVLMMNFDNVSAIGENSTKVVDVSKWGNNGTCAGTACPAWTSSGKYNGAYQFDSSNDYWSLDSMNGFSSGSSPRTASIWFKTAAAANQGLFRYGDLSTIYRDFYLDVYSLGSGCQGTYSSTGGNYALIAGTSGPYTNVCDNRAINDGNWHFAVAVYDGTNITLYVDGLFRSTGNPDGSENTVLSSSYVGNSNGLFNGSLDEVKIWNRALSADEIKQQYTSNLYKYDMDKWNLYVNEGEPLGSANYTYLGCAKDIAGNENCTEERTIELSGIAPNVTIIGPANGTITNATSVNFTIVASDTGGLRNATLYIFNTTGLFNMSFFNLGGVTNTVISAIVNMIAGTYSWFWEVFDLAGNMLNTGVMEGGNRTLFVYNASTGPAVKLISPENNSVKVNNNISFIFYSEDMQGNNLDCRLLIDGVVVKSGTFATGRHVMDYNVSEGVHNWSIWCIGGASDMVKSETWIFTVNTSIIDSLVPTVNLRYPVDGKTFNTYKSAENISLVYNVTDDYGDIFCTLYTNVSGTWGEDASHTRYVVAKNETVSVTLPDVPAGAYNWNVMCNDSSGNFAFASSNYTFTITQLTIGPCDCNSCTDCNAKMNSKSCTIVKLTQSISYSGTGACINKTKIEGEQTKTFQGQNFTITGNGGGYGIMMQIGPPMDIFMINDLSGSMNFGNKLADAKSAAVTFLNSIVTGEHRAGLVTYTASASVNTALTTSISSVVSAVNSLSAPACTGPCTAIGAGIETAIANYGTGRPRIAIVLSDGSENVMGPNAIIAAYDAANANVTIYTIGLGADANMGLMRTIASITGGQSYYAPNSAALQQAYRDISARFYDFNDHSVINANITNFYTAIFLGQVTRPSVSYSNLSNNQIGVTIDRSNNASVMYNNISSYSTSSSNWGIYMSGPLLSNRIIGNTIRTSGAGANNYGISYNPYYAGYFNNISYNNIYTNGTTNNYGLYVYGSGAGYASNDTYSYNKIYAGGTGNYNYGIRLYLIYNTVIGSNIVDTMQSSIASEGVYQGSSSGNNITSNNITAGNPGIHLYTQASNNEYSYNNITANYGMFLDDRCGHNNIKSNNIKAADMGIYLWSQSQHNNIINNNITAGRYAININTQCSDNVVDSNSINLACSSECEGIYVYESSGNQIYRNNISVVRNTGTQQTRGIYLAYGGSGSTVMYNNINVYGVSNYNMGVKDAGSSWGNTISYNTINTNGSSGSSNNWGIEIQGAGGLTGTTITYNNVTTDGDASNHGIVLQSGATRLTVVDYNNVVANSRNGGGSVGIYVIGNNYLTDLDITGNNVSSLGRNTNGNYGINVYYTTTGCRVNSNIINTNGTNTNIGIYLYRASGTTVNSNNITTNSSQGGSNFGIYLVESSSNSMASNNITADGEGNSNIGIYLYSSNSSTVNSNDVKTLRGNYSYGILVHTTTNNGLNANTISTQGFESHGIIPYYSTSLNAGGNVIGEVGGDALLVMGDNANHFKTLNIPTTNTYNGVPIYYYGGSGSSPACPNNQTLDNPNASHIDLIGCKNVSIINFNSADTITLAATNNSIVNNSESINNTYGIRLLLGSNNNIVQNNVFSTKGASYDNGILVGYDSNYNTFASNNVTTDTMYSHGIVVQGSKNNQFVNTIADVRHSTAYEWTTSYASSIVPLNNSATNLTLARSGIVVRLVDYNGTNVKGLTIGDAIPADPAGFSNISKWINATNNGPDSWLMINFSYNDTDVPSNIVEDFLRVYKNSAGIWTSVPRQNGVDIANNVVYANITNFGSVFAPLSSIPLPIFFVNPTPANGTITKNTSAVINISIMNLSSMNKMLFGFNGTNYTMYNDSLVLMMNFDNVSALGDSSTKSVDISSSSNNGTLYNGATWTDSAKYGHAVSFDGVSALANITNSASINLASAFTISAWVYPVDITYEMIFSKWIGGYTGGGYILMLSGGDVGMYKSNGAAWDGIWSNTILQKNVWYHIAATWDGTTGANGYRIYINGQLDKQQAATQGSILTNTQPLTLGNYGPLPTATYALNGTIDEARIWNRALSASEVQQQYYSNLYKYDASSWQFYSGGVREQYGNATLDYFGCAFRTADIYNCTEDRRLTIDAHAPNVTLITPSNATLTNETVVNFTASLSDATSGLQNATLYIYNQTGLYNMSFFNLGGVGNAVVSSIVNLIAGTYSWFWEVFDLAGNIANTNVSPGNYTLTVDNIKPIIEFVSPTPGNDSFVTNTITVNVSVIDANFANVTLNVYNDTGLINSTLSTESTLFLNLTTLPDGTYYINATAWDLAGNFNSSETRTITKTTMTCGFAGDVKDGSGSYVPAYVEVYNSTGDKVDNGTGTYNIALECNKSYNFKVIPLSGALKSIVVNNILVNDTIRNVVGSDDVPNSLGMPDWLVQWNEVVAWNPNESMIYDSVTLNMSYGGDNLTLYKCTNWNYTSRNCTDGNWAILGNVSNGNNEILRNFSAGDPAVGVGMTVRIDRFMKVYNVTGQSEAGRASGGTLLWTLTNMTMANFSMNQSYRIEIYLNNTALNANGIVRNPFQDNIPSELVLDTTGTDAPNITIVDGTVDVNPFTTSSNTGTEAGTYILNWTADSVNRKVIEDLRYGESVKLWYVVDYTSKLRSTNNATFIGELEGTTDVADLTILFHTEGDMVAPTIDFTNPTPSDESVLNYSAVVNVSVGRAPDLASFKFGWNGVNETIISLDADVVDADLSINMKSLSFNNGTNTTTLYDSDVLMMYNFDNVSDLGENESNFADASRYGREASCTICPIFNSSGKYKGAYEFNGINSSIYAGNWTVSNMSGITVSAWVKPTGENNDAGIVTKAEGVNSWALAMTNSTAVEFSVWNSSGDSKSAIFSITPDSWHYVAGMYNGTDVMLYVDGAMEQDSSGLSGNVRESDDNVSIGAYSIGTQDYFSGSIDEVKVWNRSLSTLELTQNYNSNIAKLNTSKWNFYTRQNLGNYDLIVLGSSIRFTKTGAETFIFTVNKSEGGTFQAFVSDDSSNENKTEEREINVTGNSAPNATTPVLYIASGLNRTLDDLICDSNLSDADNNTMNVSVQWYKNAGLNKTETLTGYSNGAFSTTLSNSYTAKGESWKCSINVTDGENSTGFIDSNTITILNTPPSVTLVLPANGDAATNRTPTFTWTGSDDDEDSMTYEFNISLVAASTCSEADRLIGGLNDPNYTAATDFKCLSDNGDYYVWSARANDGSEWGDWAGYYVAKITAIVAISLPTNSIDFGLIGNLKSKNTTTDSPAPFIIQNDGNVLVNVSITATDIWASVVNPSQYYKFKIDNSAEAGSFGWDGSVTSFTNMPDSLTPLMCIADFAYPDSTDSAEIDVYVEVPAAETPGSRSSNVTVTASLGE
jgi:hypothetical protein